MRILHKGNFNTPKVWEENNKYYAISYFGRDEHKRELPEQCCLTCKYSSTYTGIKCPYSEWDKSDKRFRHICKDNIHDIESGFEKFLESGQTEDEYIKYSHWELYTN